MVFIVTVNYSIITCDFIDIDDGFEGCFHRHTGFPGEIMYLNIHVTMENFSQV